MKIMDPTQRNPWIDPTHGHVCLCIVDRSVVDVHAPSATVLRGDAAVK